MARLQAVREAQRFSELHLDRRELDYETRISQAPGELDCRGLRRRNFSQLTLTVTEANRPAVELYERLGFDTKRVFDAFVWEG